MNLIQNPLPFFSDLLGRPLQCGKVYIGVANTNPVTNPVTVYADPQLTIPVQQPIQVLNGTFALNGAAVPLFCGNAPYSLTVLDRYGKVVFTLPSVSPSVGVTLVTELGIVGDGNRLNAKALQAAVNAYGSIAWPAGTYLIEGTVSTSIDQYWLALGIVTLQYAAPNGSAIAPMFDFKGRIHLDGDFIFDHNAQNGNYTNPVVYGGNIIAGSCLLVQGDYSKVHGITVKNGWDNGISAVQLNPTTGLAVAGAPHYGDFSGIDTYNCGVGNHTGSALGKIGAGIDIASASSWQVSNCNDFNSYIGFIEDIGAGAQCQWANCTSWYAQLDSNNPTNGSGYGFYVGSSNSQFVNCSAVGSGLKGWWLDAPATDNDYTNCFAYIPQHEGFWIKSSTASLNNCRVKGAGQAAANTYDAFLIDSSAGVITNLIFTGCVGDYANTGSNRYGLNATGSNSITAQVIGGNLYGQSGAINKGTYNIGIVYWDYASGTKWGVNRTAPGFPFDVYGRGRFSADVANTSYLVNAFGDTGNNGTFFIEDFANPNNRIASGWDPVNGVGVIQAITAGLQKEPLMLNPSGGDVCAGQANLTTGSNSGFFQIPAIAGAPTGAPNLQPGFAAICFDTTNNKIWVRTGSVWKGVVVS